MRFAILNAVMLATTALLTAVNLSSPVATADEKKSDTITARTIYLVDENGTPRVTMMAGHSASGIWVEGHNQNAAMYVTKSHGPAFALMDNKSISKGAPLAFILHSDGKPIVQVVDGDSLAHFAASGLVPKN